MALCRRVIDWCCTLELIDILLYSFIHLAIRLSFVSRASEQLQFGLAVATACSCCCCCSCKFVAQFVWTCGTHKLCWSFVDGLPPPCAAAFGGHKKSWSRCRVAGCGATLWGLARGAWPHFECAAALGPVWLPVCSDKFIDYRLSGEGATVCRFHDYN